jgi:hypothetical protein
LLNLELWQRVCVEGESHEFDDEASAESYVVNS